MGGTLEILNIVAGVDMLGRNSENVQSQCIYWDTFVI